MGTTEIERSSKRGSSAAAATGREQRSTTTSQRKRASSSSYLPRRTDPGKGRSCRADAARISSTVGHGRASTQAHRLSYLPSAAADCEAGQSVGEEFLNQSSAASTVPRQSKGKPAQEEETSTKSAKGTHVMSGGLALTTADGGVNLCRGIASRSGRANCAELVPGVATRIVGNLVGMAGVGAGYALGKLESALRGTEMADSKSFQAACRGMLFANGIVPTVVCEYGDNDVAPLPSDEESQVEILRSTPIIVSNHVSYLDAVVLPVVLNMPKFVSKAEVKNWPVFGALGKDLDFIWVDRNSPDSRTATIDAINGHVRKWRHRDRPLVLFPEGTTSSGETLLEFRKGAFVPGKPIRPVLLKYTGAWDPSNPDFREVASDSDESAEHVAPGNRKIVSYKEGDWAAQFAGHIVHSCVVLVCEQYDPSPEEKADPLLYMENVRTLMLCRLKELHRVFSKRGDSGSEADCRIRAWRRRKSMSKQVSNTNKSRPKASRSKSSGPRLTTEGNVCDSPAEFPDGAIKAEQQRFLRTTKRERIKESAARRQSYYEDPDDSDVADTDRRTAVQAVSAAPCCAPTVSRRQ